MLKPVQRQNLSQQAYEQLKESILNETYLPGQRLPSERELCDALGINRSSLREALKRLEQARLIEIRHGEGSVVLDFQTTAGFEILADLVLSGGRVNAVALRSIAEVRTLLTTETARLCARRAGDEDLAEIAGIVDRIETCEKGDLTTFQDLDFQFHYALARGSENLALVLMLNSIREVYFAFQDFFASMFVDAMGSPGLYREILDAVADRDEALAAVLTEKLIETGNQAFLDMEKELQKTDAGAGTPPRDS